MAAVQAALDAAGVAVQLDRLTPLTGGASRATTALSGVDGSGERVDLILQAEPGELRRPEGMVTEAAVIAAAGEAGAPVAPVVAVHPPIESGFDGPHWPGRSWFVSGAVAGETIARRILRDDEFAAARELLPMQLGRALAGIHATPLDEIGRHLERNDQLAQYREVADELGIASPAFELAFRWLEQHRPETTTEVLVHGDFRLGNLIIDGDGLAAVIDWELAHLGDPLEDLGWLCCRAWRFGSPLPVAGVGEREALWAAYAEASGREVDPEAARWWEVLATLKWGIMCATQVERHRSGGVRSVELAAIGRRIPEQEYDLCRLLAPERLAPAEPDEGDLDPPVPAVFANREPSISELIEAVREFIDGEIIGGADPRVGFLGRVVRNVLSTVERELAIGDAQELRHRARLDDLEVADDSELARRIRAGDFEAAVEGSDDTLRAALESRAVDRLVLNNPRWLP